MFAIFSMKTSTYTKKVEQDETIRSNLHQNELIEVIPWSNCLKGSWFQMPPHSCFWKSRWVRLGTFCQKTQNCWVNKRLQLRKPCTNQGTKMTRRRKTFFLMKHLQSSEISQLEFSLYRSGAQILFKPWTRCFKRHKITANFLSQSMCLAERKN